jgi:hypothetical protein
MTIRDALLLRHATVDTSFGVVTLRRPSAADVIEAMDVSAKAPGHLYAHLVWRHLLDETGAPAFDSLERVLQCDGTRVLEIGRAAERLYAEGRD